MDTPKVSNILSIYNSASEHALRTGLSWYSDAHATAKRLGGGREKHVARNAGIIAAMSPLMTWESNKQAAERIVSSRGKATEGIGLKANLKKANLIYSGADPMDVLKGNKVIAFYQTILNPYGDIIPVIDRHAFDVAVGEVTSNARRNALAKNGVYHEFASAYREAAIIAGIGSAQMQAVTWVSWRERKGVID